MDVREFNFDNFQGMSQAQFDKLVKEFSRCFIASIEDRVAGLPPDELLMLCKVLVAEIKKRESKGNL